MINWRDVRSEGALKEFLAQFDELPQTEKEGILLEMSVFLGEETEIAQQLLTRQVEKPSTRRPRRRRT